MSSGINIIEDILIDCVDMNRAITIKNPYKDYFRAGFCQVYIKKLLGNKNTTQIDRIKLKCFREQLQSLGMWDPLVNKVSKQSNRRASKKVVQAATKRFFSGNLTKSSYQIKICLKFNLSYLKKDSDLIFQYRAALG